MGCDIHSFVEQFDGASWNHMRWITVAYDDWPERGPFRFCSYAVFAFLAGVRNYSAVSPIIDPRDLPPDLSDEVHEEYEEWLHDAHTASWLTVEELSSYDYDAEMEDRRVTRQRASGVWDGGSTAEPGEGRMMTYREFLGPSYFRDLALLETINRDRPTRVVFWFDG